MGGERTTTTSQGTQSSNQTQTATMNPKEEELLALRIEREKAAQGDMIGAQTAGLKLVQQLLQGTEPLPGFFQQMSAGISPTVTQDIVNQSMADIAPQFSQYGLLDSGTHASVAGRISGDIRRASEEFNIGNKFNLLNLALSGQAQVQQPLMAQSQMLGSQLAGLRSVNSQGSGSYSGMSSVLGMNPFMKSFQQSAGQSLGSNFSGPQWLSAARGCWVASEIFGGWDEPETVGARVYMSYLAPSWLREFYLNHGQRIAAWIHPRPWAKELLRPFFLLMARAGMRYAGAYR